MTSIFDNMVNNYLKNSAYSTYMAEANYYAQQYGLDPASAHNGEWDAFRHAYASARMTQDTTSTAANLYGYANEIKRHYVADTPSEASPNFGC